MTVSSLKITEIFYSLQGESNTVGLPTVFIRLTGCPLRCVYCDTAYAFSGGERMSIDEIINRVGEYRAKYITVTGGEPLAQSACLELMSRLADLGYQVSIETSGALDVSRIDDRVVKVMDLKTPSSGELHRNLFDNIAYLKANDQVKFVIGDDHDYQWSKSIIDQYNLDQRCELLFSPTMGQQDPTELAEKILNDNLPVRFQIQLHKLLWNDAQGR
ncbi:MAG TPA: 7-carboxy-7-deazaguanine synthase QueE [Methylococcaceae bacterium]|nr:7-carboxy-7-deazaguanine synthase QueE [Methylococcaceae bacterium]